MTTLESWTLILILAALPAFAGSEPPLNPGDVVSAGGFGCSGTALYRRGSAWPSPLSNAQFFFSRPTGLMTYSPALNRMILSAATTLEILDTDGHITPLLTLPEKARVTALAGVGREILAVVVLPTPSYHFELWRIAATTGAVTEQIGLPLSPPPLFVQDITSIDLAADRCTLAYAVVGEVIHRYDICARRPLEDLATGPAWAVHFLPHGNILVSELLSSGAQPIAVTLGSFIRLARYDREGRLVSTAYGGGSITSIALDPDGSTAWIGSFCSFMAVDVSSGARIGGPWPFGGFGVAVAGEWRAAEQPVRGRAIR